MQLRIPPWSIVSVNDETAFRAIDGTVYTNTTGKTMFVNVSARCATPAVGDMASINAFFGAKSVTSGIDTLIPAGIAGFSAVWEIGFNVMPGITYFLTKGLSGTGAVTLMQWIESY